MSRLRESYTGKNILYPQSHYVSCILYERINAPYKGTSSRIAYCMVSIITKHTTLRNPLGVTGNVEHLHGQHLLRVNSFSGFY